MESNIEVVICTYNGEKYIREQLLSIAEQSRQVQKISIFDDCSSDSTIDIIKDFSKESDINIGITINEKNLGYIKNFINGINKSSGYIVFLCDQDDLWERNKVERICSTFELSSKDTPALVFSDAVIVDENNVTKNRNLWETLGYCYDENNVVNEIIKRNVITGATAAMNRPLIKIVNSTKVSDVIPHDYSFATIAAATGRLIGINEKLTRYRIHGSNQIGINTGIFNKLNGLIKGTDSSYLASESKRIDDFIIMLDKYQSTKVFMGFYEKKVLFSRLSNSNFLLAPVICLRGGDKFFRSIWSIIKITYAVFRKNINI